MISLEISEMLLACLVVGIALVGILVLARNHAGLTLALLAALAIRMSLAVVERLWQMLPQGGADAVVFERQAWEWAQSGCGNLLGHLSLSESYVHSWIVGNIYACTERAPLMFQMVNVLLGVASVYLIAQTARLIWGSEASVRAAWAAALFPALILYSSVELREAWVVFFLMLGVYWLTVWMQRKALGHFAAGVGALVVAAIFHGGIVLAVIALVAILITWLVKALLRSAETGRVNVSVMVASTMVIVAGLTAFGATDELRLSSIGDVQELDERFETIDEWVVLRARGGAVYPAYLNPESNVDVLWQTPVRMAYLLFGPPPWEVRSFIMALGMIDGILYMAMAIVLWRYRSHWWYKPELRLIFLMAFALAFVFGWGTSNFGTGMRHRAKFVGLLLIMVAGLIKAGTRRSRSLPGYVAGNVGTMRGRNPRPPLVSRGA